jgi:hypothetical protein
MFGHPSSPSQIYSYGAHAPTTNGALVEAQLWAAHRYRNALVELERSRRTRVAEALQTHDPGLLALEAQMTALADTLATVRADLRRQHAYARRHAVTEDQRREIAALRDRLARLRVDVKARKTQLFADGRLRAMLAAIDDEIAARQKSLRAASALYWGTYLAVEEGLARARHGPPPQFHRWMGDGKLAVQLQGGLAVADAFRGEDTRLRLVPVAAGAYAPGAPRRLRRTHAYLRIGSDRRAPVWAEVPVVLHRPLPANATIKWVYLLRRHVATHAEWRLQFVVTQAEGFMKADAASMGTVAVDVGWRRLASGLRVAYWVGDDGMEGQLVLPEAILTRLRKVEALQSLRDTNCNAMRGALVGWLHEHSHPAWLQERAAGLTAWRSPARLAALAAHWRDRRFAGDQAIYRALEAWRVQDKHLYEWQAHQRQRTLRWRDELYRHFAAGLRRRYRTCVIEDTDWRQLQRRAVPEAPAPADGVHHHQRLGAPGHLLAYVRESLTEVVEVDATDSTQRCSTCSQLMHFDAANLVAFCPHCGAQHDQDQNACKNLLRVAAGGGILAETGDARTDHPSARGVG